MNLYALAIFLGAFLLFQVQPLIAKVILPWFGGSAAVWLTCMLFFQVALLGGYYYAHLLATRAPAAMRPKIHLALLAVSCAFLPILPGEAWKPPDAALPELRIALLLAATLGLPYVLLAATSPLVQSWYAQRHSDEPYRFFAVSNAGSLLGLLSYPTLVEPFFTVRQQAWIWSGAFLAFGAAMAALVGRTQGRRAGAAIPSPAGLPSELSNAENSAPPERGARVLWIALPACASALLLAVTNHITQNVAPVPLLWVLPLSLYLLSFVLTFGRKARYNRGWVMKLMAVFIGAMAYALAPDFVNAPVQVLVPLFAAGLFVCCWVCHGELARLRPPPAQLTSYYLRISLGGALGGVFVIVVAPMVYTGYYELHAAIAACAALALLVLHRDPRSHFYRARWQPDWLLLLIGMVGLAGGLYWTATEAESAATLSTRNFYGTLRVVDLSLPRVVWLQGKVEELPESASARKLVHGTIDHGAQFMDSMRRRTTCTYYVARSGVALAIREAGRRGPVRVGVVGLGTGTLAALSLRGDVYRFYEINPEVVGIAQNEFTYLKDTTAKIEIVPGDARLVMEREPPQNYDVLAVDAFSGDAIPVHLITIEAFREYFRHMKPGGALVLHISNQHLDLQPVVQKAAEALGKKAKVVESTANDELGTYRAFWVIVSDRASLFEDTEIRTFARELRKRPALRPWTDDYSNLLQVLDPLEIKWPW